ncbi:DEAD/DEAH box helicase [Clostridium autoethanogenum]|nr:DEAD/DEAH box helicase [Clostridium autoethanogenum]
MDELKRNVLQKWLEIEYYAIANKARFIKRQVQANYELILNTIRCLDYVTTMEKEKYKEYVITVVALMWEYSNKEEYDLKNFIIKILSRIGYPTSAIIIDDKFDKKKGKFFKPKSAFDILTLTLEQSSNEILIRNNKFLLTEFQKKIWDRMDQDKVIGISAPTSAGKSFVLLLKTILKMVKNSWNIVYIVPTLSLVNQVIEDYNKMLKLLKIENYKITNSYEENSFESTNTIYVLTQEKALVAFSNEKKEFNKKIILVVDEIQNIERILNDTDVRSKILFDTLIEFRHDKNVEQIVIAGPRIEDIGKLGKGIFGVEVNGLHTLISPVLNLTYSIRNENNKYYFRQYCAISPETYERKIENTEIIKGYGKKEYTNKYLEYLKNFINNIGSNEQNIIFAPTSKMANKIACYFVQGEDNLIDDELQSLISYYEKTVNKNYAMCKVLKGGIAYHHGKLPMHVRRTLEKAICDKKIKNVVCTTTLMQGMNMPAQNVIIRNPHLYIRKKKNVNELSSYEMANLRGRAGRLLKDFIGRTYVLDESSFKDIEGYNQIELFEDATADIPSGYGEKYKEYMEDITEVIESANTVDASMQKYGYLVSYIRQSVLRYGKKNARKRMTEVGIELTKEQIETIDKNLKKLKVSKDICFQNRYWDPFVLDYIYKNFQGKMPDMPTKRGAKTRLDELMKFLRDNNTTKPMYDKYIPALYQSGSGRSTLRNYCIDWACENPLSEILVGDRYQGEDGSEKIDETIELLENTVSFNVPLLLKPIFDIFKPDSIFLTCMQAGAYKICTREMIKIGVPRETAIYLNEKIFADINMGKINDEKRSDKIRRTIRENFKKLPYWIQVQLEFMR